MKKSIICVITVALFYACSNKSSEGQYEEQKMSIEMTEKNQPASFLTSDGTYREALFSSKEVLEGSISSKATVAVYKNVVLQVTCSDGNRQELGKQQITIFKTVAPGQTIQFKEKINVPDGTSAVGWEVLSAEAE
jgi:hypothetical protein